MRILLVLLVAASSCGGDGWSHDELFDAELEVSKAMPDRNGNIRCKPEPELIRCLVDREEFLCGRENGGINCYRR